MRGHRFGRRVLAALVLASAAAAASGCGARWAYRQGQREGERGNWDLAVARLTRALQKDPDNIQYKLALENARVQASRQHYAEGRRQTAAGNLDRAAEQLEIAVKYDPANKSAADDLQIIRERIQDREEQRRRLVDFEAMRSKAQAAPLPVPVLSPRSTSPIHLSFPDQSLQKVFEALGKVAGVNILFDPDFRDKRTSVNLTGVTFEEALNQLTFANRLFYKVLDRNTVIIVPESPAKRRIYDDVLLRTFYVINAETKEVEPILKTVLGPQAKVVSNAALGAITIVGTPDELLVAQRILELNDKARGEVVVEVEILEVNRIRARDYGIRLANYGARVTLAPTKDPDAEDESGFTTVRAHLLASLNLSDFIVSIPAALFTQFLQTDSSVRILANPRLRAAEGKKTLLKIGTEVPIPVTTFTSAAPGGPTSPTFAPATSFQYRNVGVNLELTPRVTPTGDIVLELAVEFSLPGARQDIGGTLLPSFLTRNVNGFLRLRDGETALIGGLLQDNETEALSGVLGIQSIPVLGKLLSGVEKDRDQTEILISITPHLVRAPKVTAEDLATLYVGTKESVRVPSSRPSLFGEEEPEAVAPAPSPSPTPPPPPGPSIGRPPGTVSPSLPAPGQDRTPAVPAPAPVAVPTPIPPSAVQPTPAPSPAPSPSPSPPPGAAAAAAAAVPTAAISPAQGTLRVGQSATVSLVLMNAVGLTGVEVLLSYDPSVIEAVDVSAGALLTMDGAPVGTERGLEPGRVRARLTRASGIDGSGVVAAVIFRGVSPGASGVAVESLTLATESGPGTAALAGPARVTVTP